MFAASTRPRRRGCCRRRSPPPRSADPVETELRSFSPADVAAIAGVGPGGSQPAFGTIAVAGQPSVAAGAASDTLMLAGANGIAVNTDPATDAVAFAPVYGSGANTVCEGNDARLADARTPTAHAGSHKTGGSDAISVTELGGFASGKLAGRTTAGSGALEAITPSANLSLTAGTVRSTWWDRSPARSG